mgnify:CR=1 FL=1
MTKDEEIINSNYGFSLFCINELRSKKCRKQLIGKWCNPYTYQSTGELKGFHFQKNGKCSAINVPSLDLRTWKIDKDGYLIIEGFSTEDDGRTEVYKTRERIEKLTSDSLRLVMKESSPRLVFSVCE